MLRFPDLTTVQLALTSGAVPPAVADAPAEAAFDERGPVWVRPAKAVPRAALADLRRLGVESDPKARVATGRRVSCWPQLLPARREASPGPVGDATPVLFDLPAAGLPGLAGEILRLGNDRQSARWLDDADEGGPGRALLRVVGPPYYALLRAIDRDGGADAPRAYVERAPRVLVEVGHTHPLADRLRPAAGKLLLIGSGGVWRTLDEAKFRDLYEVLEFHLPAGPSRWRDVPPTTRIEVPLRLARGPSGEAAEMWVLRDRADEQLEQLVRHADNRLLGRLAFAVGRAGGRSVVVVRARPSRQAPPVLVLDGEGYRPYLRLPNLFLPVGTRLHPPLRRDAVARLLAPDPARVNWLGPWANGRFVPESLPEDAFRPLGDWVDYVLDVEPVALDAWVQSARFDFEPFVCGDDAGPAGPPAPRRDRSGSKGGKGRDDSTGRPGRSGGDELAARRAREATAEPLPTLEPGEAVRRLGEVEARFLGMDAPLDDDGRRPLWREMAVLNDAIGRHGDAVVCWANALWEAPEPEADWVNTWAEAEARAAGRPEDEPDATAVDRVLAEGKPSAADLRLLATTLIRAASGAGRGDGLASRLGRVQHFWAEREGLVPVRVAWLAWSALARLAGGDALSLARARDRLLERLHRQGLGRDLDLPGFLRRGAGASGERSIVIGRELLALRDRAHAWTARDSMGGPDTGGIADLMFAFALARLGDAESSGRLLGDGLSALDRRDAVASWVGRAFEFRVRRALDGKPAAEALPTAMLKALETFDRLQRYKVDRLREHSTILEPHERIRPYRHWHGKLADDVAKELARVVDLTDRAELAGRIDRLLTAPADGPRATPTEARILGTALEVGFRLGDATAGRLFGRVLPLVDKVDDLATRAGLLERATRLAAHFDRAEDVRGFVGRLAGLLDDADPGSAAAIEPLLAQSFRGLRKLGMRDETALLLDRLSGLILRDGDGSAPPPGARASGAPGRRLRLLLHVASGWFDSGLADRAWPILDEARALLFGGDLAPVEQTALACGYVRALGLAPLTQALPRVAELFDRLERIYDTFTTNSHYSLSKLDLFEAIVSTLSGDDFMLDEAGRRWLEDDEYLVRRRIHRDVRAAVVEGD